jgi:hypothetical protein
MSAKSGKNNSLTFAEIDRLMGEDPDDRAIREAHGFAFEDDYRDISLICRNGCGRTYYDISSGKVRQCSSVFGSTA